MSLSVEFCKCLGALHWYLVSTEMTAICVGVLSRSPRDWSDLVAAGSGGFRAGGWLGCCRVMLCGSRSPSVWLTLGTIRPCSRSLVPGPARLELFGRVGQWRAQGRSLDLGCRWLTLCGLPGPLRLTACEHFQTKLPGRKFQSHLGVPPVRLIVMAGGDIPIHALNEDIYHIIIGISNMQQAVQP
jgi:hypothetical protein